MIARNLALLQGCGARRSRDPNLPIPKDVVAKLNRPEMQVLAVLRGAFWAVNSTELLARLQALNPRSGWVGRNSALLLGTTLNTLAWKLEGSGVALFHGNGAWLLGAAVVADAATPEDEPDRALSSSELRRLLHASA